MKNRRDHISVQRVQKTYTAGLSLQELAMRQRQGLTNAAPEHITKTTGQILADNIFTLFNAFNLLIGICLALVGAWTNMVYLVIILGNVLIGILQELHAKRLVENLSLLSAPKAQVVRDGRECEIAVEDIVLDDITLLCSGNQICADSTVVHGEVEVNEALLTGESDIILKRPGDALLSGSFVVSGTCFARVEQVGADNFVVKLAMGAKKHKKIASQLLSSMRKVTKFTGFFIIPIGILLFMEAYFIRSNSITLSVVLTSAALLGMLPKGLVLMINVSLATGVIKLSRKRVLVQEMQCIETLAQVDMLCLDKTGTITQGRMRVCDVIVLDHEAIPVPPEQAIRYFTAAMGKGNATFAALQEHFAIAPVSHEILAKTPFSSERKWSGVTLKNFGTLVMGAPEILMGDGCQLPGKIVAAQQSGQRVLYLGFTREQLREHMLPPVTPVAAVTFYDPIRNNAKETLRFFKREGVAIKIISGDTPLTVSGIAQQAGLEGYNACVDMSRIHSDEEIRAAAEKYQIFGRVTPAQKRALVQAFKAQGHTVAMTGDGVNDVLALREADCGIAIGTGSDAAKQIAQLVLLDSDFAALPHVVMEGRRVINNITRVAGIFFIKTIYSILLSVFSILTLSEFPFIPIQITLIDAVIEAFPAFFLSFESNSAKPERAFLKTAVSNALPYALLILISFFSMRILAPVMGVSAAETKALIYYLTGWISLMALIQSCRPFNLLRVSLCTVSAIGFYTAAYLFAGLLDLERLTGTSTLFFAGAAVCCGLFSLFVIRIVHSLWNTKKIVH